MNEDKPKRAVPFYYQVASILLLLILVGFTLSGLWGVVRVIAPQVTISDYGYKQIANFDSFAQSNFVKVGDRYAGKGALNYSSQDTLTRAQAEAQWRSAIRPAFDEERRGGLQQIILWVIAVLICLPLYLYHHRVVQRFRARVEEST